MPRGGVTRVRVTATAVVTLLVVLAELGFLTFVNHLGDGLDRQREAHSQLAGAVAAVTPASGRRAVAAVRDGRRAARRRRPGHRGRHPRRRAPRRSRGLPPLPRRRGPPSPTCGRPAPRCAATWPAPAPTATTSRRRSSTALLVLVSVGWFISFRRLVDRHRSLERQLTARQAVDAGERRLLALVQSSADLIVVLEADGTASFVSPSAQQMLDLAPEDLVGRCVEGMVVPEDVPVLAGMLAAGREGDQQVRLRLVHADGRTRVADGTLSNLVDDPSVGAWVLTLRDVTERTRCRRSSRHQAFHDALTGLANRALFSDRLDHALRRRAGAARTAVVLFCDLDDFKNVNDTHGHTIGDQLLVTVAERIRESLREGDTAARLGGDEFAVLLEDADAAPPSRSPTGSSRRWPSPSRWRASPGRCAPASAWPRPPPASPPARRRCATPTSRCTGPRSAASPPWRRTTRRCTPCPWTRWPCAASWPPRSRTASWSCTTSRWST